MRIPTMLLRTELSSPFGMKSQYHLRRFSCTVVGPDGSRGFCVNSYSGLWKALAASHQWPSSHTIAVVGPLGPGFAEAAESCARAEQGCDVLEVSTRAKTKLQSIRFRINFTSPNDLCALHSRFAALEGSKAVV